MGGAGENASIIGHSFMFEAFGLSDPGCVRPNNEDYFISDTKAGIFIVADGMGGAKGGERASQISAERLYSYLLSTRDADDPDTLKQGFRQANWAVLDAAKDDRRACPTLT